MKHFTIEELTRSETALRLGISNTPTALHVAHLTEMVDMMLDPLREAWAVRCADERMGTPALRVSSGYRSALLNASVGGSPTSAHSHGYAVDIVPMNGRLSEFKAFAVAWLSWRAFDQLISEDEDGAGVPRWLHLGWRRGTGEQRRQFLRMRGGKYSVL